MPCPAFDPVIFLNSLRHEAGEMPPPVTLRSLLRLLPLKGEEFVHQAYLTLLERRADEIGLQANAARAQSLAGRLKILLILLISPERRGVSRRNRRRNSIWRLKTVNVPGRRT